MTTLRPFDPIDKKMAHIVAQMPPGRRIQRLLAARELIMAMKRARIRQDHPELSNREINLMILREIERGKKRSYPAF